MMSNYERWDKWRRKIYPDANHGVWESWDYPIRVAGFYEHEWWVLKTRSTVTKKA